MSTKVVNILKWNVNKIIISNNETINDKSKFLLFVARFISLQLFNKASTKAAHYIVRY